MTWDVSASDCVSQVQLSLSGIGALANTQTDHTRKGVCRCKGFICDLRTACKNAIEYDFGLIESPAFLLALGYFCWTYIYTF